MVAVGCMSYLSCRSLSYLYLLGILVLVCTGILEVGMLLSAPSALLDSQSMWALA